MIDLNGVKLLYHPPVVEVFMDFVLPDGMFDIVLLYLFTPVVVEVVNLACNFPTVLQVVSLVDLRVASFPKQIENQVPFLKYSELTPGGNPTVLRCVFISDSLEFLDVQYFFFVN